ncbi:MAG: molybdopterin converting factor subunit 1 [Gammaproteobacteria bacterium]|nr:molybdopterin converting factor subunit 1 [Gammaproteobacteria bacterium]MBU1644768.1 molybdopterin converting factor subunit 1 [Gammaproteobacteria bacterium]MBU1973502.1 molybdopterin converting factor subunit 1 [Gammaproteobacteria bacterium]
MKVLYFASLREALGASGEEMALPDGVGSTGALRDHLAARGGAWLALTQTKNLRCAVNQRMVGFDAAVADGDEVAFFPPVTGG